MAHITLHVHDSKEAASQAAARLFYDRITAQPTLTLGLATGTTPVLFYRYLKELAPPMHNVRSFNLDEYIGLSPTHPQSFYAFMKTHYITPFGLQEAQVHIPIPGGDPHFTAAQYEHQLQATPIDLQLLGIGTNAHIGFNEPGCDPQQGVHIEPLTLETRQANAAGFASLDEVPTHAITMGIQNILDATHIVLLAFGENKAKAIQQMMEGPITPDVPASYLQQHPRVDVFLDQAAASALQSLSCP
jgi:glucosamine-6-phosphate deaminase